MRVQFSVLLWDSEERDDVEKIYEMDSEEILKNWYATEVRDLPNEDDPILSCYIDGKEREDITEFGDIIEELNIQFWNAR